MRKDYVTPRTRWQEITPDTFLAGSTEEFHADPNDGTEEALSKEGSIWDKAIDDQSPSIFEE